MEDNFEVLIQRIVDTLVKDEGFIPYVYKDSEGYFTIGHGIMVDKRRFGGLEEEESLYIVEHRVKTIYRRLDEKLVWFSKLSDKRKEALAQMSYNLGLIGLLGFGNMLRAIKCGDYELAADEALDSLWAKQVGDRATRIADLIRHG